MTVWFERKKHPMADRHEDVFLTCPNCESEIKVSKNWTAGGVNDYGGWVLKCKKCSHPFAFHLGRDILDSNVVSGAEIIDSYDDELKNKHEVLAKYNIET